MVEIAERPKPLDITRRPVAEVMVGKGRPVEEMLSETQHTLADERA